MCASVRECAAASLEKNLQLLPPEWPPGEFNLKNSQPECWIVHVYIYIYMYIYIYTCDTTKKNNYTYFTQYIYSIKEYIE